LTTLAGSSATPKGGLSARVLVAHDFEEIRFRAKEVSGKIIFFMPVFYQRLADNTAIEVRQTGAFERVAISQLCDRKWHSASTMACSCAMRPSQASESRCPPIFLLQIPLKKRTLKVLNVGAEAGGALECDGLAMMWVKVDRGIPAALGAAALFGLSTPLAKLLVGSITPLLLWSLFI
jgi:hypothetical protein